MRYNVLLAQPSDNYYYYFFIADIIFNVFIAQETRVLAFAIHTEKVDYVNYERAHIIGRSRKTNTETFTQLFFNEQTNLPTRMKIKISSARII